MVNSVCNVHLEDYIYTIESFPEESFEEEKKIFVLKLTHPNLLKKSSFIVSKYGIGCSDINLQLLLKKFI